MLLSYSILNSNNPSRIALMNLTGSLSSVSNKEII